MADTDLYDADPFRPRKPGWLGAGDLDLMEAFRQQGGGADTGGPPPSSQGPPVPGGGGSGSDAPPLMDFTAANVFNPWPGTGAGGGASRDAWADARDAWLQPKFTQYRTLRGPHGADEGDLELMGDPRFRSFLGGGAVTPSAFDDPSTQQLEHLLTRQQGEIENNPGLNQLLQFLDSQFQELSETPGYSPAEMAMLNTQAFEPIEDLRKASTERSLQRTASRGFLPSSGLAELDLRQIDRDADRLRTQANRDLSIAGIDRRDQDLSRAMQYATTRGLTIPQGQRAEMRGNAERINQLPREALDDLLRVIGGSPSSANLSLTAAQTAQEDRIREQQERQQQQELYAQLAQFLTGLNW